MQLGHRVFVETGAGVYAGHGDDDYERAGAKIAFSRAEAYGRAETVVSGKDNVLKSYALNKGDPTAAFARQDLLIVEGEYATGAQEHAYIEPHGVVARYSAEDGVTVWGSLQCPYYVQKALMSLFGPNTCA